MELRWTTVIDPESISQLERMPWARVLNNCSGMVHPTTNCASSQDHQHNDNVHVQIDWIWHGCCNVPCLKPFKREMSILCGQDLFKSVRALDTQKVLPCRWSADITFWNGKGCWAQFRQVPCIDGDGIVLHRPIFSNFVRREGKRSEWWQ